MKASKQHSNLKSFRRWGQLRRQCLDQRCGEKARLRKEAARSQSLRSQGALPVVD